MTKGFSAVLTTGIYCRPECSASPKAENVVRYGFAAAAEAAGFRACLRCRPYRRSEPVGWLDSPELVCRAVRLILDGALDEANEDQLAVRLGVSGRHLRRLFSEHVGATPDTVARSRRAHFARRLLDDTDLSVTDIAFASGFGSVRQMNRSMRDVFRASPTELRARRRKRDRLIADGGLDLRLPFNEPLAWDQLLAFLAARAIPGVESVSFDDGGVYRRTAPIDGLVGVLEVRPGESADHLVLRAHLPRWEGMIHVVERVRRLFDLDADMGAITAALSADCSLRSRVKRRPGLRVPGAWDPFELGVRAVVGQQVSVGTATRLAGRMVEAFGRKAPGLEPLGLQSLFPDPASLADADLRRCGLTSARAGTVRELARRYLDGVLPLDASCELEECVTGLCTIPGIGPWTAHYIAMRACGERDAFPASDLGLRRALGNGRPLTPRELEARAEAWRPWRAYAAMHLWSG